MSGERFLVGNASVVATRAQTIIQGEGGQAERSFRAELVSCVLMAAFAEAVVMVAGAQDLESAKRDAKEFMVCSSTTLPGDAAP